MQATQTHPNKTPGTPSENHSASPKPRYRLTKIGEQMARLPIDPKVARILLAAKKHDCMAEILVIVSALSIQDPRERPLEAREAAAKAHERFADKQSDFLAYLNIWDSFQRERDKGLSNRQMVAWCHQYFLSHLRMREWRELHAQLAQIAIEMGLTDKENAFRKPAPPVPQVSGSLKESTGLAANSVPSPACGGGLGWGQNGQSAANSVSAETAPPPQPSPARAQRRGLVSDGDLSARLKQKELAKKHARAERRAAKEASYEQIHRALLTGLIANVGMKSPDGNDYTGARGSRFHLFPASALFKSKPKWVMAAELTETTRLYARDVAAIQPEWIEQEAPHLVKYHYFEPHWEQKRGEVVASERVTLYGLTVLPRRPVAYGRIAPEEAREIFIRSALVAQEMGSFTAPFFVHNQKLIREVAELEHKSRRQDVLVDDEILFEFYDARLPKTVFKSGGEIVGQSENAVLPSENKAGWVATQQNVQRLPENVGRILESDICAASKVLSDTSIRPTRVSDGIKGSLKPHIRPATTSDATAVAELFRRAVKHISNSHYSEQEKNAWLQGADDADFWQKHIDGGNVRVATHNGRVLGFIEYQPEQSHLNCLYTDPHHQRQGIATALLNAVLPSADSGKTITVDASKAALAFFQKQGFVRQHENQIPRNGLVLTNYRMVRQANHAQKQPETVGRILESDKTFDAAQTSDTSIRPTRLSGSLKPQTPSEKPLADIRTFAAWLKTAERDNPRLLFLSRDHLMQHAAAHITEEQFPKHWQTADGKFKLSYRFEPHHPLDGVTLTLPLTVLNRISPAALEWLVPGMIREKIQLQIKALPKQIRRICVPVPEFITQFLSQNPDRNAPILPQLAQAIAKTAGDIRILEQINQDEWAAFRLPEHCYFNLRIIDDGGQELAMGRDLIQIQQQLGKAAATTFRDNTQEFERDNVTAWDIGTLPESIKFARGKQQLTGYLGLQKEKDGRIALRLFDTSAAAEQAHRLGVIELMKLQLKEQVKDLNKGIQGFTQAAMLLKHINADTLRDDLTQAVCDRAFIGEDELPRNEKAFKEQIKRARSRLPAVKEALSRYLQETAAAYAELNGKLGKHPLTHLMRQRLQTLLAAGFATRTPWAQWPRLPIYLKAMTLRLEKYSGNPARDAAREADIQELEQMWQEKTDSLVKQGQPISDDLAAFRWMIEELRVSLFAQELKTPYPVSVKRLLKEWEGNIHSTSPFPTV